MRAQLKRIQLLLSLALLAGVNYASAQTNETATNRISGWVSGDGSYPRDVVVYLCDQRTGLPISPDTRKPAGGKDLPMEAPKLMTTLTDKRGAFAFENLPTGEYRVVAQRGSGTFKGAFELYGSVIQLFGWADHIQVPSPEAEKLALRPPGEGVMVFDQEVGNDDTLFLLSTKPPAGDAILSFYALGTNYMSHVIAMNRMPQGRTTLIGLPPGMVHAFFFAPDNSPGYALESFEMKGNYVKAPKVQFVAGWSDGRHTAPARLQPLVDFLREKHFRANTLLGIKATDEKEMTAELIKFADDLERKVEVPGHDPVTVGDLLAADAYMRVAEYRTKAGR